MAQQTEQARRAVMTTAEDVATLDRLLALGRAAEVLDADVIAKAYDLRTRMAGAEPER